MGDPKPNQINSYEFSWSSGAKESVLNTNVSGSSEEGQFKGKSTVVELEPNIYRMTLSGFTDNLPYNTTYLCKLSGVVASVTVEKGRQMTVWIVLGGEHESEWERNSRGLCQLFVFHFFPLQTSFSNVQLWVCFWRALSPGSPVCCSSIKYAAKKKEERILVLELMHIKPCLRICPYLQTNPHSYTNMSSVACIELLFLVIPKCTEMFSQLQK